MFCTSIFTKFKLIYLSNKIFNINNFFVKNKSCVINVIIKNYMIPFKIQK